LGIRDQVQQAVYNRPSVFYSLDTLGDVLKKEKRHPESEEVYWKVFDGRSRALGVANPDTASSAYGLACALALEGKRDEAFTNLAVRRGTRA
jgi:hypothetical protein